MVVVFMQCKRLERCRPLLAANISKGIIGDLRYLRSCSIAEEAGTAERVGMNEARAAVCNEGKACPARW